MTTFWALIVNNKWWLVNPPRQFPWTEHDWPSPESHSLGRIAKKWRLSPLLPPALMTPVPLSRSPERVPGVQFTTEGGFLKREQVIDSFKTFLMNLFIHPTSIYWTLHMCQALLQVLVISPSLWWGLYSFPRAAVTEYHRLGGLNDRNVSSPSSGG